MSATPPPPPQPPYYQPTPPMSPQDQRLWATLTHIGGIFFPILVPLIAFLVLKDRGAFIAEHTKTALNFHITVIIGYLIAGLLTLVLIGFFLIFAIAILVIVFGIIAATKANAGEKYEYPLTIRFIS
jgi:uncharacterized Tic20 family protein